MAKNQKRLPIQEGLSDGTPSAHAGEPPAWLAERIAKNWHRTTPLQFWPEVSGAPQYGSAEERATQLIAIYEKQTGQPEGLWSIPKHALRRLALDLMCASFPPNHPPSDILVRLMKLALSLPFDHDVGGWVLDLTGDGKRVRDGRGRPDATARLTAMEIDAAHYQKYEKLLSERSLALAVQKKLQRTKPPSRPALRAWRSDPYYRSVVGNG
jgi:hypothetical protein